MTVAKDQIGELVRIIKEEVSAKQFLNIMLGFKETAAFKKNKSFALMIDRLYQEALKDVKSQNANRS